MNFHYGFFYFLFQKAFLLLGPRLVRGSRVVTMVPSGFRGSFKWRSEVSDADQRREPLRRRRGLVVLESETLKEILAQRYLVHASLCWL